MRWEQCNAIPPLGLHHKSPDKRLGRRCTLSTRRVLLLGLLAANAKAAHVPDLQLIEDKQLHQNLRRKKQSNSFIASAHVNDEDVLRLKRLLEDDHRYRGLLHIDDSALAIVNSGCTKRSSFNETDFVEDSIHPLPTPLKIDGISGGIDVTHEGILCYEVMSDDGEIEELLTLGFFTPSLSVRLISPQSMLRYRGYSKNSFRCDRTGAAFHLERRDQGRTSTSKISVQYDACTHLPMMRVYKNARHCQDSRCKRMCDGRSEPKSHSSSETPTEPPRVFRPCSGSQGRDTLLKQKSI